MRLREGILWLVAGAALLSCASRARAELELRRVTDPAILESGLLPAIVGPVTSGTGALPQPPSAAAQDTHPAFGRIPWPPEKAARQQHGPGDTVWFCFFSSDPSLDAPDRAVIDLNGDGAFDDDPVLSTTATTQTLAAEGRDYPVDIFTKPGRYLLVRFSCWYEGSVGAGDRTCVAAVIDRQLNGVALGESDFLIIDANEDGLHWEQLAANCDQLHPLNPTVVLLGRTWKVLVDRAKPDVSLQPYTGPTGRLEIHLDLPANTTRHKRLRLLRVTGEADGFGPPLQLNPDARQSITLPVAQYHVGALSAYLGDGDGELDTIISMHLGAPLEIAEDRTTTLTIGPLEQTSLKATRARDKLVVMRALQGPGGIFYNTFIDMREKPAGSPLATELRIFRMPDGQDGGEQAILLTEGRMQHTERAAVPQSLFVWDLPETVTPGDRLRIEAVHDLGPLGQDVRDEIFYTLTDPNARAAAPQAP